MDRLRSNLLPYTLRSQGKHWLLPNTKRMQMAVVRMRNPQVSLPPLGQANQQLLPRTQRGRSRSTTHPINKRKLSSFDIATIFRIPIYSTPKGQARERILQQQDFFRITQPIRRQELQNGAREPEQRRDFDSTGPCTRNRTRSCNATNAGSLIKLTVEINRIQIKALLDSGSSANFISGTAALRAGLKPYQKQEPYFLHVANREEMPIKSGITHALRTKLNIQGHQEKINLDVFGLAAHDVVLGLPWLREHNPRID
jgi:hypothetical protein